MPRRTEVSTPAAQTVNVSVDVPQNKPASTAEPEEKSPMWYWDLLQEVPKDKWGNTFDVMGFRLDPQAGRQAGAKGFLFQVFEPITPLWIKQNYGGGKFRCILQRNSKFFKSHEFDVEGPPKYDLSREAPNVPATAAGGGDSTALLQQFVTVLREELQHSREANATPNPATEEAIGLLSRASEKAMDIVANRASAGTPGSSTQQLSELVGIVKGLLPAQSNGDGGLMALLAPLVPELLKKFLTPSDPLAELAKLKNVMELLDGIRGGVGESSGKAKDWRAMLAEGVIQKGPEFLRELRDIVAENRETAKEKRTAAEAIERVETIRRGHVPAAPAATPAAAAPATVPQGPLRTVPIDRSAPADAGTPTQAAPAAAPPAAAGMSATESDAVANFMQRRIVEMVNEERDAEDVVDFIEEIDPTMNDLLAQFTAEMVTTFLADKPIIGDATRNPRWNVFLTDAQRYIKEIREEDRAIQVAASRVPA